MLLGVNIDHVATLRNARGTSYPSPLEAALLAETHGADYITLHLREDRRHIKDDDVAQIAHAVRTHINLEMALTEEMLEHALRVRPKEVCIVPEKRQEITTEGGLDVLGQQQKTADFTRILSEAGIRVSLFIDADEAQSAHPPSNCIPAPMPMPPMPPNAANASHKSKKARISPPNAASSSMPGTASTSTTSPR